MDMIYKPRYNCYNLSDQNDKYVSQWTNGQTTDTIINVILDKQAPHLFYTQVTEDNYQWCGPLLMFAQYFAQFSKTKIRLEPKRHQDVIMDKYFAEGIDGLPHLGLVPLVASHYYRYVMKELGDLTRPTTFIGYMPTDGILAKTHRGSLTEKYSKIKHDQYLGEDSLFKQFECFEPEIYYGIIASIIVISFVTSLYKQSLKSFFTTFWSYLSVILSDYHSIKIKTTIDRLFAGLWLIVCTLFLAAFSGQLRDVELKPKPIDWIDSWEDLHQWKHLSIHACNTSGVKTFADDFPDHPFSRDFIQRLKITDFKNTNGLMTLLWNFDGEGVRAGRVALVFPYYVLQVIKRNLISDNFREDIDFHISGGESQPYFTITNRVTLNETLANILDHVIQIIRESGLYESTVELALTSQRIGQDASERLSHEFDDLSLSHLKGIMILYSIFITCTLGLFITEVFESFQTQ